MTEFIQLLLIGTFWIWGVNFIFKKGQIFEYIGEAWRYTLPKWITKPVIDCQACMSSIHGTIIYFLGLYTNFLTIAGFRWLLFWPMFCICLSGINHIIIEHLYDTSE